jgi:hypothetical protein
LPMPRLRTSSPIGERPKTVNDGRRSTSVRVVEIAELLGVSHQRASKIADEPGFLAPIRREGPSRLWNRREVLVWAKRWRRAKPCR